MRERRAYVYASLVLALVLGLASGAAAQGESRQVAITHVDDSAYPQVTAYLTVQDQDGYPVTGLTADDVRVGVEGKPVLGLTALETDASQPIALILALDVSTPTESLAQIQAALESFVGSLGQEDVVALMQFADDVRLVQDYDNAAATRAALEGLAAEGDYTALNEAVLEAAALAARSPLPRTAVVVLTDSDDNRGRRSLEEALEALADGGSPIHVIGFGAKMTRPAVLAELSALSEATAGQWFTVPSPEEAYRPLRTIATLLRQGYRVTFAAPLPADDGQHRLEVVVAGVQATARFVARRGDVSVRLAGLRDGDTVGGAVELASVASAPGPIAFVQYQLDGQTLAEVSEAPYSYAWDSTTVEPGAHKLVAVVTDAGGNRGELRMSVNVVPPVALADVTTADRVEVGRDVEVTARVEALTEIAYVEFLLDGITLGREAGLSGELVRFSFQTGNAAQGGHLLTVRAVDVLGRRDEVSLGVEFVAPPTPTATPRPTPTPLPTPAPQAGWIDTACLGGSAVVVFVLVVLLIAMIHATQRRLRRVVLHLEIANEGNVRDRYEVQAQDPDDALRFEWRLDGVRLDEREVSQGRAEARPVGRGAERGTVPDQRETGSASALEGVPGRLEGAQQTMTRAAGFSSAVAGLFATLGTLPGPAGAFFRRASSQLRRQEMRATRVTRAPGRLSRTASRLSPFRAGGGRATTPAAVGAPTVDALTQVSGPKIVDMATEVWSLTPYLEPGRDLVLALRVDPVRPFQTRQYEITVLSRSTERDVDAGATGVPMTIETSLDIVGLSWDRRFLPYVVVVGAGAAILFAVFRLVSGGGLGL